ncbi:MAG: transposase [Streptosporangiaceae bacterium]
MFRGELYRCFTARADALFELADAVLCADGPVKTLAALSLAAEHRRGHGALYDAVNHGRIEIARLRRCLAGPAATARVRRHRPGPPPGPPDRSGCPPEPFSSRLRRRRASLD